MEHQYGGKFYNSIELKNLLEFTKEGEKYTMVFNISSTCEKDIEIGLSGDGGWFKTNIPANSNNALINVTDRWKTEPTINYNDPRLENRAKCGDSSEITIYQIQLFSVNCLLENVKNGL